MPVRCAAFLPAGYTDDIHKWSTDLIMFCAFIMWTNAVREGMLMRGLSRAWSSAGKCSKLLQKALHTFGRSILLVFFLTLTVKPTIPIYEILNNVLATK